MARYENGSKLAGVIYIHRISDKRFTGMAGRNFKMFRELCGDSSLKNVILVTNMWGEVSEAVGETREQELTTNFFKQKTAYEMIGCDWSSDVCSSDLPHRCLHLLLLPEIIR